ncbi:MAG TPA: AraC family transcriptional regulator [Steroidobacteraceae bacterium]|jgi:AraC-like DNA-binding protein|nr:AraC family transcriptional regulator [Steroidobacteraceae bacterium]
MGAQLQSMPARHWSTDEAADRPFSYWVDTVCDRFLELEIDSPVRRHFHARLDQTELGAATANWLCADAQRVRRTRATADHAHPSYLLMQLRAGRVRIRQAGCITPLHPGECILLDGAQSYELDCPEATRSCVLQLSDAWLRRWVSAPERLAPRHFAAVGWSGALCAAVGSLEIDSCDHLALPRGEVAEHIAALLTLALGPEPRDYSGGQRLRERLKRTVGNRLMDPGLSPASVAAEHRISLRTLHYAFAAAGTTFVEELMQVRLQRAQELLADPRLQELPVIDVAARCGFTDPSHFARRFRRQFGLAPLAFRRAVNGSG